MTELVVFGGRGGVGSRDAGRGDLGEPLVTPRPTLGQGPPCGEPRVTIGLGALQGARRADGGRFLVATLAPDVDGLLDLGVLDLELEGSGQRCRQIERQPRRQEEQDPARSHCPAILPSAAHIL